MPTFTPELTFGPWQSGMVSDPGVLYRSIQLNSGFNPASLFASGEEGGAYDFSSFAYMYQSTDTSAPVTAAGQLVGRVTDLSGKSRHLTQATAASQPTAQAGYLSFDGTDDGLATGAINFGNDKMTVLAAVRTSLAASRTVVCIASFAGSGEIQVNPGSFTLGVLNGDTGTSQVLTTGPTSDTNTTIGVLLDLAGATALDEIKVRFNGTLPTQTVNVVGPAGGGNFNTQGLYIGSLGGVSQFFQGRLIRIIAINRVLTGTELTQAEAWIAAGYGGTL